MNTPNPALVTERAAQRLPRLALLLFCAAYVLPGLFGRDPWKNAELSAFGVMVGISEGRVPWLSPTLGGLPTDAVLLPHWLGALSISLLSWIDPAVAARVPFALLLALTLVFTWYTTYQLARTEAAQPLAFAFGGEAPMVDYARAMADGALLALIATLGLLQLGHETTPELSQLFAVSMFLWSLAAAPFRPGRARIAVLAALPLLACSGAPAIAVGIGAAGALVCARSHYDEVRRFAGWVAASALLAAMLSSLFGLWAWRVGVRADASQLLQLARLLLWFLWPVWPLALWTLWRWRRQLLKRHVSVPLASVLVALVACVIMGGADRALMLALPGLAVLAAFALPTLRRSAAAAVDWFSVFFFSSCAIAIWVVYVAMQSGSPSRIAANVARLAPGYPAPRVWFAVAAAIVATLAWLWLVRWRTGRHQHALWKSLVLSAGGVALNWLLLMTLWLPLLDYARSYRPLVRLVADHVPPQACLRAPGVSRAAVSAMEFFGRWRVDGRTVADDSCEYMLRQGSIALVPGAVAGWRVLATLRRPTDSEELFVVYRRNGKP